MIQETEFYNAGDAQNFKLYYDQPGGPKHAISGWPIEAPKQGFFKVPREIPSQWGGSVLVEFDKEILEKFGDRGFIAIALGEFSDEQPFAASREEAKRKGTEKWKKFCRAKIQEFDDENEMRVSRGLPKAKPGGFVIHAHRELGLAVPSEDVYKAAAQGKSELDEMREILKEQGKLIEKLTKGK